MEQSWTCPHILNVLEGSQVNYGSFQISGFEARHRHIIAKVLCHKLKPFLYKGSYMELFNYILSNSKPLFVFQYLGFFPPS